MALRSIRWGSLIRFEVAVKEGRHFTGEIEDVRPAGGVEVEEALFDPHSATITNRRAVAPYGMAGGEPGATGANWIERADGTRDAMTATDKRKVSDGDVFVVETPGGGGFGKAG